MTKMIVEKKKEAPQAPVLDYERQLQKEQAARARAERLEREAEERTRNAGERKPTPRLLVQGSPARRPSPTKAPRDAHEDQSREAARQSLGRRILDAAVHTQRLWFDKVTVPVAGAALSVFLMPFTMPGCGPGGETYMPPERKPAESAPSASAAPTSSAPAVSSQDSGIESQIQKAKYWWPGFIMKNGQLMTVYMGYGDDTFYNPQDMYGSKDSIPLGKTAEMKKQIESMITYMQQFYSDKNAVSGPLEGTILLKRPTRVQLPDGTYAAGGYGGTNPVVVLDAEGNPVAGYAGGAKAMTYDTNGVDAGKVLIHEFLHLEWDRIPQGDRDRFKSQSSGFFNAYGSTYESDRLFPLLNSGVIDPALNGHSSFNLGSALLQWGNNLPGNLNDADKTYIKYAIQEYIRIHSEIVDGRTKNMTAAERSSFTWYEAFAYMGANSPILDSIADGTTQASQGDIPVYMNGIYSNSGMKGDVVLKLSSAGAGYFTSEERFKELVPYIRNFIDWMKALYPEMVISD